MWPPLVHTPALRDALQQLVNHLRTMWLHQCDVDRVGVRTQDLGSRSAACPGRGTGGPEGGSQIPKGAQSPGLVPWGVGWWARQGSWVPTGALRLGFRVPGVAMVTQLLRNLLTSVLSDSHVW